MNNAYQRRHDAIINLYDEIKRDRNKLSLSADEIQKTGGKERKLFDLCKQYEDDYGKDLITTFPLTFDFYRPSCLTLKQTLAELNLPEFEIYNALQKGLRPYQKPGFISIYCPYDLHQYRHLFDKYSNERDQQKKKDIEQALEKLVDDEPHLAEPPAAVRAVWALKWKNCHTPQNKQECEAISEALKDAVFRKSDVENIKKVMRGASALKRVPKGHVSERYNRHCEEARDLARNILEKDPDIKIIDVIFNDDMPVKSPGVLYAEDTLRGWIGDLFPEKTRRGGAPKKK